jgi:hypothetical protein
MLLADMNIEYWEEFNMNNPPRDFKGIWIPAEIWLSKNFTIFEKTLFSELHSLDGPDGCYASNQYLMDFFDVKERKLQDGLAKLKAYGYVWEESFDGRTRILRTTLNPKQNDKSFFSTSDPQNPAPLTRKFSESSIGRHTIYREKKDNKEQQQQPDPHQVLSENSNNNNNAAVEEQKKIPSESITYKTPGGKEKTISESDIYKHFLKSTYKTEIISEAIRIVKSKDEPIGNIIKLLESICFSIENKPPSNIKSSRKTLFDGIKIPPKSNEPSGISPWSKEYINKKKQEKDVLP